MKHDHWLIEKPSLTNLAARRSSLDHESQNLPVRSSDKGRADKRQPHERRDEKPHRKAGE